MKGPTGQNSHLISDIEIFSFGELEIGKQSNWSSFIWIVFYPSVILILPNMRVKRNTLYYVLL